MPEMPENEALADFLAAVLVGHRIIAVELGSFTALKTVDPPVSDLVGRTVTGTSRRGKHLVIDADGLYLVVHLFLAGWVRWHETAPKAPLRPGKGPIVARVRMDDGAGFDLTEQGTQHRLSLWVVRDLQDVPSIAALGPEALELAADPRAWRHLLDGSGARVKTLLRDQAEIAGIGNAFSDEILHLAKVSPYAVARTLDTETGERLRRATVDTLTRVRASLDGARPDRIKPIKKAGYRVHARAGSPCPECGTTIASIRSGSSSFEYCPTCQTGGRVLADRATSRFVK